MFVIYIHDRPTCLKVLKAILFADDSTTYSALVNIRNFEAIQKDINKFNGLAKGKQAPNIYAYYIFGLRPVKECIKVTINDKQIEHRTVGKCLGVIADETFSWIEQCKFM